ncbi:MAG: hypothetical protein MUF87_02935 [Anaerolineae bacterium]|nr:hypothetical protein [Anaerolineae bacterium]
MIQKIRNWLIDTYNGLYVIVLKPYMPSYVAVVAVVLAFLFGLLIFGYWFAPVQYYDGSPHEMTSAAQDQWVINLAAAFQAGYYDPPSLVQLLNQISEPAARVERLIQSETGAAQAGLQQIFALAQQATGTPAAQPTSWLQQAVPVILGVILMIILSVVTSLVWQLLIKPNIWDKLYEAVRPKSEEEIAQIKQGQENLARIRREKEEEERFRKETAAAPAASNYGPPVMQKITNYFKGRSYDESFEIESADEVFLGQCGASVKKTLASSNEPAAVEVWLFDKDDFVRTLNKIYVAEGCFNDPSVRGDLENEVDNPDSDLLIARPGATIRLETGTLILEAKLADLQYDESNRFFEGFKIQIQVWYKGEGSGTSVPAAMPTPIAATTPAFAPPPTMPAPPPSAPIYNPPPAPTFNPPPLPQQPPRKTQDDDPFGGTGDFTPIGGQ